MSKKRLIPKLQLATSVNNSKKLVVVITKQFGNKIEIGDPVSQSKIFQDQSADELIFLNIESNTNNIKTLSDGSKFLDSRSVIRNKKSYPVIHQVLRDIEGYLVYQIHIKDF